MSVRIDIENDRIYLHYEGLLRIKEAVTNNLSGDIREYCNDINNINGVLLDVGKKRYQDWLTNLENKYGSDSKEIKTLKFVTNSITRGNYDCDVLHEVLKALDNLDENLSIGTLWTTKQNYLIKDFKILLEELISKNKRLIWS